MGADVRRSLAVLSASLGVHALALFGFREASPPAADRANFELSFVVEAPPVAPPTVPEPPPKSKPAPRPATATHAPASAQSTGGGQAASVDQECPSAGAEGPLLDDLPRASTSGAPTLFPGQLRDPRQPLPGTTLHPDPELEAVVAKAREQARVEGRVRGMLSDGLDSARATSGLAGPEVTELGHALAYTLNHADGGSPVQLGVQDANASFKRNYARAAAAYGQSGDPGFAAPGRVPEQTERLQDLNAPTLIRAQAQARQTALAVAAAAPLFSVTLEIVQAPGGLVLSAQLLTQSGNGKFDDFVLAAVPAALSAKSELKSLRATWEIEGWLVKNDSVVHTITSHLAFVDPVLDSLAVADPASAHFEYRARLLRSNR